MGNYLNGLMELNTKQIAGCENGRTKLEGLKKIIISEDDRLKRLAKRSKCLNDLLAKMQHVTDQEIMARCVDIFYRYDGDIMVEDISAHDLVMLYEELRTADWPEVKINLEEDMMEHGRSLSAKRAK